MISSLSVPMSGRNTGRSTASSVARMLSSVCEATCRYAALTCEETLTAAELFALDPQEILIPKRRVLPERRSNA